MVIIGKIWKDSLLELIKTDNIVVIWIDFDHHLLPEVLIVLSLVVHVIECRFELTHVNHSVAVLVKNIKENL